MSKRSKSFLALLLQDLTDPEESASYIMAARKESREMFLTAIMDVAKAHEIAKVARRSGLKRESLYKAFSEQGNPRLDTLDSVFDAMNLEIGVNPKTGDKSKTLMTKRHSSSRKHRLSGKPKRGSSASSLQLE